MIEIAVADDETRALWKVVGELAGKLPGDWALIGGLMVQLHAVEHGFTDVRVTHDIDLLGQARPQGTLMRIDRPNASGCEASRRGWRSPSQRA